MVRTGQRVSTSGRRPTAVPARLWLLGAAGAIEALACQDLIGLTPGQPDPTGSGGSGAFSTTSTGGSGAFSTTSTGGDGGSGGSGGTTGTTTTTTTTTTGGCPRECVPTGPCENTECVDNQCVSTPKPAGTLVENAVKGDCKGTVCDGSGAASLAPWFDPDDGEECTWDACAEGVAGHSPKLDGTPCSSGDGVCAAGVCQVSDCAPPNGTKDGAETGIDCGGACEPCLLPGDGCKVSADCGPALFCSTGACAPRVLLANIIKASTITLGAFRPDAMTPWTLTAPEAGSNLQAAGVAFDAAGEGVAVIRQGSSGARFSRWKAETWSPSTLLPLASSAWLPTFARTDLALFVFAQNANSKHQLTLAAGPSGDPFGSVGSASSPLSGGAGVREGHASFFHAPIEEAGDLVEIRFLAGAWSPPALVLDGNHTDTQPVLVPTPTGHLLVAAVRENDEHQLVWRVLAPDGPKKQGTIPETLFLAEQTMPRRVALAPLPTGGALLAFRDPAGALDVRVATDDGEGGFTWTSENVLPSPPLITGEPALATGLPGARAELVWIAQGGDIVRHARWLDDGTWTTPSDVLNTGAASIAIATP